MRGVQRSKEVAAKAHLLRRDAPVVLARLVHEAAGEHHVVRPFLERHQIAVVDVPADKVVGEFPVDEAFYGIEFSRDGTGLFCSGAGDEVIHAFAFKDGYLFDPKVFKLRDVKERGIPAGMALSSDARRLFVANVWGQRISRVDLEDSTQVTDITLGASNGLVRPTTPTTPADEDTAAASKRAQAALEKISDESPFPYACRLDEKRHRLYVSLWAQAAVAVVDLNANQVTARWPAELAVG